METEYWDAPIEVSEIFEQIPKHNPISRHHWTEQGKFLHFVVRGGGLCLSSTHKTEKAVQKNIEERKAMAACLRRLRENGEI